MTSAIIDRFSKNFHPRTQQRWRNEMIIKGPITPSGCRHVKWNVNVRKLPWLTDNWRTVSIVSLPCVCPGSDAACPRAADIVLALDQSTSIVSGYPNYDNWYEQMLGFAATFAQSFPISPNLTRVSYSHCGWSTIVLFNCAPSNFILGFIAEYWAHLLSFTPQCFDKEGVKWRPSGL